MKDYDKIYLVRIYLKDELIYIEHFIDLIDADKSANFWESKGYQTEITRYSETMMLKKKGAKRCLN